MSENQIIAVTQDGGVTKVILEEGNGDSTPQDAQEVDVTYIGTFENGEEFDKNVDEEYPFQFFIAGNDVIKGWSEAIKTMKKGERSRFTIKPEYAYGAAGQPPTIPANATLIFEIKLIDFRDREPGKWDYAPEERIPLAEGFKAEGNDAFKAGNLEEAIKHYEKALDYIDLVRTPDIIPLYLGLNLNLSLIYLKQKEYQKAIQFANDAIAKEKTAKGLFRLGNALEAKGDIEEAVDSFKEAIQLDGGSVEVKKALKSALAKLKAEQLKQKALFQGFFKQNEIYDSVPVAEYHNDNNTHVFLDIKLGDAEPERIEIELFDSVAPKTAANFKSLCTGEKGASSCGKPLHYKNTIFHRIIKGFMMQGGDFQNSNGTGGESIYGHKFDDENFLCKHIERGMLSMANSGPGTNGSQFFITFKETSWLDGKHVVFGKVVKNIELLDKVESISVGANDVPEIEVRVVDCGVVPK